MGLGIAVGVQALERWPAESLNKCALLHVVDKPALQALAGKNPIGERRALAAMEKAGGIVLRDAARSARVALESGSHGTTLQPSKPSWLMAHWRRPSPEKRVA